MLLISNLSNNTSPNPSEKIFVAPGHVFHRNNNLLAWIQIKKICILELKVLSAPVRIWGICEHSFAGEDLFFCIQPIPCPTLS